MDADNVFNHALPPHEIGYVTFFPEGQASRQKFYSQAKASRLTDGDQGSVTQSQRTIKMLNSSRGAQVSSQAKSTCIFGGFLDPGNSATDEDEELFGEIESQPQIQQSTLKNRNSNQAKTTTRRKQNQSQAQQPPTQPEVEKQKRFEQQVEENLAVSSDELLYCRINEQIQTQNKIKYSKAPEKAKKKSIAKAMKENREQRTGQHQIGGMDVSYDQEEPALSYAMPAQIHDTKHQYRTFQPSAPNPNGETRQQHKAPPSQPQGPKQPTSSTQMPPEAGGNSQSYHINQVNIINLNNNYTNNIINNYASLQQQQKVDQNNYDTNNQNSKYQTQEYQSVNNSFHNLERSMFGSPLQEPLNVSEIQPADNFITPSMSTLQNPLTHQLNSTGKLPQLSQRSQGPQLHLNSIFHAHEQQKEREQLQHQHLEQLKNDQNIKRGVMRTQITNYSNKDQINTGSIEPIDGTKDSFLSDSQHMNMMSSNKRSNGGGSSGYLQYHKHEGNASNYNSAKSLRISKPIQVPNYKSVNIAAAAFKDNNAAKQPTAQQSVNLKKKFLSSISVRKERMDNVMKKIQKDKDVAYEQGVMGSQEYVTGEQVLKGTKRGWRQRQSKNDSGTVINGMAEASINLNNTHSKFRFQNNLNLSLKEQDDEYTLRHSNSQSSDSQFRPQNTLDTHSYTQQNLGKLTVSVKDQLPTLPTSNKEIHQIFSPLNLRKKKNLKESRESGPRINGIMGVSANNGTNSEVDLSRTSDGNATNREFDKLRYTQSNQRRFRITKLHDSKKPGTQESTINAITDDVVQTDSILNLSQVHTTKNATNPRIGPILGALKSSQNDKSQFLNTQRRIQMEKTGMKNMQIQQQNASAAQRFGSQVRNGAGLQASRRFVVAPISHRTLIRNPEMQNSRQQWSVAKNSSHRELRDGLIDNYYDVPPNRKPRPTNIRRTYDRRTDEDLAHIEQSAADLTLDFGRIKEEEKQEQRLLKEAHYVYSQQQQQYHS